jgi:hypothetical protein
MANPLADSKQLQIPKESGYTAGDYWKGDYEDEKESTPNRVREKHEKSKIEFRDVVQSIGYGFS